MLEEIRSSLVPDLYNIIIDYCKPLKESFIMKKKNRKQLINEDNVLDELNKYLVNNVSKMIIDYTLHEFNDIFDMRKENEEEKLDMIRKKSKGEQIVYMYNNIEELYKDYSIYSTITEYDKQMWGDIKVEDENIQFKFVLPYIFSKNNYHDHTGYNTVIMVLKFNKQIGIEIPLHFRQIINYISLEIGGTIIDRIYGVILEILLNYYSLTWYREEDENDVIFKIPLPFDIMVNNKILIRSLFYYHEAIIFVKLKKYDKLYNAYLEYELLDNIKINGKYTETIMKQNQFIKEVIHGEQSMIKINFNHPIHLLYFCFTDKNDNLLTENIINELILKIENQICIHSDQNTIQCKHIINDMIGYYFITFTDECTLNKITSTINFSRLDNVYLELKFSKSLENIFINIATISENIFLTDLDMAIIKYSN